jgi:hypothetical protein
LQNKLPGQSAHESEEINTVDKAIDVNGDPNKDSDHTNVAENMVVDDSNLIFGSVELNTVAEENNVHDVCVQEITLNNGNNEQTKSRVDEEVEQNDVSQKIFKTFKMKMLVTMLGWKIQMKLNAMLNKIMPLFWKVFSDSWRTEYCTRWSDLY